MDILKELEKSFNHQTSIDAKERNKDIADSLQIVRSYITIEQGIAVMSDLIGNKSYICIGSFGHFLNLPVNAQTIEIIDSIWEENIYKKIHPDDIFERHLLELKFFHFLKGLPMEERLKFSTSSRIRALGRDNEYHYINHRTLYLRSTSKGDLWLSLCLYNFSEDNRHIQGIEGKIINHETGQMIPVQQYDNCAGLLSSREKEVLSLVEQGHLSKEISERLNISLNTVNRHRQNILQKLQVNNSMEAVKTARAMNLL